MHAKWKATCAGSSLNETKAREDRAGIREGFAGTTSDSARADHREEQTIEAVGQFINRTAERSLRPERKKGLAGIWAFRVTSGVRVFYTQQKDSEGSYSELFHVGPHDDYRTVTRKH